MIASGGIKMTWEEWRKDDIKCAITFILLPIVAAIAMGAAWGIVDWMRAYGTGVNPFPYFDHSHFQAEPFRRQTAGSLLGIIEDVVNWYNLNFRGATRFGSGLGLLAGAFIALSFYGDRGTIQRTIAGTVAGATIGCRSVLMLGSGAPLFLVGFVLGAIAGAAYMLICAGPPKLATLPMQKLPQPTADPV